MPTKRQVVLRVGMAHTDSVFDIPVDMDLEALRVLIRNGEIYNQPFIDGHDIKGNPVTASFAWDEVGFVAAVIQEQTEPKNA